jgi:hypothetical protein
MQAYMTGSLHHTVIDSHDLAAQARFWCHVLHWRILSERPREVVIGPDENAPVGICFMPSPEGTFQNQVPSQNATTGVPHNRLAVAFTGVPWPASAVSRLPVLVAANSTLS